LRTPLALALSSALALASGCTFHHSKQGLLTGGRTPSEQARFVTEEDSGLALFGLFQLSEPDHYAVLLERARRKHQCASLHDAQLDFYTDYWLVLSFPISRITLLCEPLAAEKPAASEATAPASGPAATPPPPPSAVPASPAGPVLGASGEPPPPAAPR
jgi:hypothetical protein